MFSAEIKKRFKNPQNAGELKDYNVQGSAKGDKCSDHIVIKLRLEKGVIKDAKFQVCGCPGAICTADAFIDLIKGQSVETALSIGEKEIAKTLGLFPQEYLHCAALPLAAFQKAILQSRARIIGITGGKGGTGKSTVATALAFALAKEHKVLLVDADVDCPNDHLFLDIERQFSQKVEQRIPQWDLKKCIKCGLCSTVCKTNSIVAIKDQTPIFLPAQCNGCGACLIKCPVQAISWSKKEIGQIYVGSNHGVDLLSGELKANEPISEFVVKALNEVINQKKFDYDYIIVDTAAGTHCPVIAALEKCEYIFAVTEPSPLGRHDLELILQLGKKMHKDINIIINRSDIGNKQMIKTLAQEYQATISAEIPYTKDFILKAVHKEPIENENINKIIKSIK